MLQLIGPWTNSTVKLADVAFIPAVNIADAPRYQWRGVLVDPARSFYPLDEMKQMIDVMSAYKMNTLHLHLSEDEGFRVEITNDGRADGDTTDYTQLAIKSGAISYQSAWTSNWSPAQDGRTGYWTQSEFIELVAYAADHGIASCPRSTVPDIPSACCTALPSSTPATPTRSLRPARTPPPSSSLRRAGAASRLMPTSPTPCWGISWTSSTA